MNQIFYAMNGNPNLFPSWALAADEYLKFMEKVRIKRIKERIRK